MDYTTLERTKQGLHATANADDALLGKLITAASRAVDRKCTGVPNAVDYFKLETITAERLRGQMDYKGTIICYPHKPIITAVSSFSYQENVTKEAYTVDAARIEIIGPQILAYPLTGVLSRPSRVWVTLNYTGGLATSGSGLPEDLQELVTLLAIRFYREEESGLTDAIGVAELSTLVYTKAWPVRVMEQIAPYIRFVGWNFLS